MPFDSSDLGYLAYMGLLTAAILGSYLVANRRNMGKMLQQAMIWVLIFVGFMGAYGMWGDIRTQIPGQYSTQGDTLVIARARDGHFYAPIEMNGKTVTMLVDTGATGVALSKKDAQTIGIDLDSLIYSGMANTANGAVETAPVKIETIRLGDVERVNFRANVTGGDMDISLLGMSFLAQFSRIEIVPEGLRLTP